MPNIKVDEALTDNLGNVVRIKYFSDTFSIHGINYT